MPRNPSGIYSLPASNPVAVGTTIEASWANDTMNDLAAEITNSLPRDGTAPMLAPLILQGDAVADLAAVPKQQLDAAVAAIAATTIVNTPAGGIAAITVQAAINELDAEKQPKDDQLTTLAGITTQQATDIASLSAFIGTLLDDIDAAAARSTLGVQLFPTGSIIDFAGASAPAGFLACPLVATDLNRTTYADLFAAIGTTWGAGDGTTTFGMPWFPADYVGVQANANVGTPTVGEVISHTHTDALFYGSGVGGGSGIVGTSNIAADFINPFGGPANLAAGHRVLKCVKI